jgi:uncharacterized protein YcnI
MIRKLAIVGAIVTGAVVLLAGPAFAHVEIERDGDVSADGAVAATLDVPNEQATAGTVKIELVFPESPRLTDATAGAVNGWTATVQKNAAGAVEQIVWTGGPLTGDDDVELPITVSAVPDDVDTIDFKAVQTYDNGDVVRWIDPTPASGVEPEHPAPVLLVRGDSDGHDDGDDHSASDRDDHADSDSHDDGISTGAIIAIVAGVVIVLAVLAFILSRTRRDMGSKID